MEHKSRKMFAAIAVIMLCAVAIVGVGYAYTASTINSGNVVNSEYVTVIQDGTGAYKFVPADFEIEWNSADSGTGPTGTHTTVFTFETETAGSTVSTPALDSYKLCKIGNTFNVKFKQVNGELLSLTCAMTTNFVYNADLCLFAKVTVGETPSIYKLGSTGVFQKYADSAFGGNNEFSTTRASADVDFATASVEVYYGYLASPGGVSVSEAVGTHAEVPSLVAVDPGYATLTFTVTVA